MSMSVKLFEKKIQLEKKKLINKFKRKGIYENFGQKEVWKLRDFVDVYCCSDIERQKLKILVDFDEWCISYNGE